MKLFSKEYYEIISDFEKKYYYLNLKKESKKLWSERKIYKNKYVNDLFLAYLFGYSVGKFIYNI